MSSLVERLREEIVIRRGEPITLILDDGTTTECSGPETTMRRNPDGPEAANEIERLREALTKVADRAAAMRKGTDDWFELAEFETVAREALSLHKADRHE